MKFEDIRGILHYVPQFRGQTFVVQVEGEVIDSENFANVLMDLAVLHSLSIRCVVVYGARHQIRELAARRGVALSSVDGTGVTDDATLEVSVDAISRLGTQLMQHLTSMGLQAAMTNCVVSHPAGVIRGRDLGSTGTIDRVEGKMLEALIEKGMIPVIAPLGFEKQGRTLRLNSANVAAQVAIELKAAKILFVVPDALQSRDGRSLRQLSVADAKACADQIVDDAEQSRGTQLRTAARACEHGVPRCHFVDGRQDEALLGELFSVEGVGTMVYADAYSQIRPARKADIPGIASMIRHAVQDEELVKRTRQEIRENLGDYFVLEIDGSLVGVVAVQLFSENRLAEVGCLYIRKSHEGQGHGGRLVGFAEKRARALGAERLFALSTQAYNYFETKLGFQSWDEEHLPPARLEKLRRSGRNSRIMVKTLGEER
ncbi:MAG: amino-acid N-acetyltransferase [Verrucomicrobiales bacterium]|nr:amino-acid N-acetyltransferase [Verrucomicrobiales bacterium]